MNNETKRERFVRVAEARTNRIIDNMRLLGNCAHKGNYEYTEADVKKICSALEQELKILKARFQGEDNSKERFTLN